jgi:hypothetical protein
MHDGKRSFAHDDFRVGRVGRARRVGHLIFKSKSSEGFALEIYLIVFGRPLEVSLKIAELNI